MTYPAITPSPPAPQRTQAGDAYAATADTWAAWFEGLADEQNALAQWFEDTAAALVSSGLSATSSASITIGTGSKSFAASAGSAFTPGQSVVIASVADPTKSMTGTLTEYDRSTGNMTVDVTTYSGSGTFASWSIGLALVADLSAYLQKAGGTMTGLLTLAAALGLVLTPGAAPASPVDGQIWRETNKLLARVGSVNFEVILSTLVQAMSNKSFTSSTWTGGTIDAPALNGPTVNGYTEGSASASGTSFSPNLAADSIFYYTITGNCTINLPAVQAGKSFTIVTIFTGAFTVAWAGGSRLWADGEVPEPTSANGKRDVYVFLSDETASNWMSSQAMANA